MNATARFIGPVWGSLILIGLVLVAIMALGALAGIGESVGDLALNAKGRLADVDTSKSHAGEKHGETLASQIRHCIDNGGHIQTWFNHQTGRYIEVCMLQTPDGENDDEHFGLRVCEDDPDCGFAEITAFDIEGNANQVEWYLGGRGYVDITPP